LALFFPDEVDVDASPTAPASGTFTASSAIPFATPPSLVVGNTAKKLRSAARCVAEAVLPVLRGVRRCVFIMPARSSSEEVEEGGHCTTWVTTERTA
jgi:hypothetical protein